MSNQKEENKVNCIEISTGTKRLCFYMFSIRQMRQSEFLPKSFDFEAFLEYEAPINQNGGYPVDLEGVVVDANGRPVPVLVLTGDVQSKVLDAFTHKKKILLHVALDEFRNTPVIDAAWSVENYVLGECPNLGELNKDQYFGKMQNDCRVNGYR